MEIQLVYTCIYSYQATARGHELAIANVYYTDKKVLHAYDALHAYN